VGWDVWSQEFDKFDELSTPSVVTEKPGVVKKSVQCKAMVQINSTTTAQSSPLTKSKSIYQLKITLLGIKPLIWRRFQVEDNITFSELHVIIQIVMDWENYHLHSFSCVGDEGIKLSRILTQEKVEFFYTYDFGDEWQHQILVEKILFPKPNTTYPICLAGKRACPPEDCGGDWGYLNLLKIVKKPSHPEYREAKQWLGRGFKAEYFNVEDVNKNLYSMKKSSE
jgi:integrase/recombinase XerD